LSSRRKDPPGVHLAYADLDLALTGSTGTVRLLDASETVWTAHLSTAGLTLNLVIDTQLHTVPMRSLTPVLTGHNRKAALFVPAEDVTLDAGGENPANHFLGLMVCFRFTANPPHMTSRTVLSSRVTSTGSEIPLLKKVQ